MTRLDHQRAPSKLHVRPNSRKYVRGYDATPHTTWGEDFSGSGGTGGTVVATGATAGIPGTWTPAGSTAPASVAALQVGTPVTVTANPTTTWTVGQYVQTLTAGVGGRAYWHTTNGWVSGAAP